MIDIIDAYNMAVSHFHAQKANAKIACVLEYPAGWIFYEGDENIVEVGATGIIIDKKTGQISDFLMPRDIAIFREAAPIDFHSLFSD